MNILIAVCLLFYAFVAYFRPSWALSLLLVLLPSYLIRFSVFSIPSTLLEGMILVSLLLFVIQNFKFLKSKVVKKVPYPFSVEIILWLLIAFAAAGIAKFSFASLGSFKAYFLEPAFLFILLLNNFRGLVGFKKIVYSLSFSALLISLVVLLQKVFSIFIFDSFWQSEDRVLSVFSFPNAVGLYLAPLIMLFIFLLWQEWKDKVKLYKIFYLLSVIILSLLSIFWAKSEGAIIAVLGASFISLLLINKKTRLVALGLSIVFISLFSFNTTIRNYSLEKFLLNDLSGQIKKQQWIETKKMLAANHWWPGVGLANYQESVALYHNKGIFVSDGSKDFWQKIEADESFRASHWQPTEIYLYPHNIFLNFWSELGLLGLLLFLWITIKCIYFAAEDKILGLGIIMAIVAIYIHGLVDVPYFKNDLSMIFFTILSLAAIIKLQKTYGNSTEIHRR